MEDVEKKILYYEIYKAKKEVYEEYQKKNIFTKDTFYNKHKKDIDQYKVCLLYTSKGTVQSNSQV